MKRYALAGLGLAFGLGLTTPARADPLGARGDAVFSAERLFGVRGEHWTAEPPGEPRFDATNTQIAFGFATHSVPYDIPRLAFDYLVVDKLSVGGSLGLALNNVNAGAAGVPDTTVLVAPRVGFLHMFGRVGGIWPRAGFTYHNESLDGGYKESGLGLDLECMFPLVMAQHFGVELGLTFDQSLTARHDPDNGVAYDVSYRSIGLEVGLFGWI